MNYRTKRYYPLTLAIPVIAGLIFFLTRSDEKKLPTPTTPMKKDIAIPTIASEQPQAKPTPKPRSTAIVESTSDESILDSEEKVKFYNEVDKFSELVRISVNKKNLVPMIKAINARGQAGVNSIVRDLNENPTNNDNVKRRINLIDYLGYRSKWDPKTRTKMTNLITKDLSKDLDNRTKGVMISEKMEMLSYLTKQESLRALETIATVNAPEVKMLLSQQYFETRSDQFPNNLDLVEEELLEYVPNFIPGTVWEKLN